MPEVQAYLLTSLTELGITVVGSIVEDSDRSKSFFVRVAVSRDSDNLQRPSNRRLNELKASFASEGVRVEFLLHDLQGQDIEAGLRATLLYAFPNTVRNAFLSIQDRQAQVWIEPKHSLSTEEVRAIEQKAGDYLEGVGINVYKLVSVGNENLPGNLACLKLLRQLAPVSVAGLKEKLEINFSVPSEDWLKRRLDALRKAGKVVWIGDGTYACTLDALRGLGSERGARSPDVSRLLALARRGR